MAGFDGNSFFRGDPWGRLRRSGGRLRRGDTDRYVDEMRASAALVGLDRDQVPATEAEIADYDADVRSQLRVTSVALRNVLWGFAPPMPRWVSLATPARPAWAGAVALAAAMLPPWARRLYGLPGLGTTDLGATLGGRALRQSVLVPSAFVGNRPLREAKRRLKLRVQCGRAARARCLV